MQVKDKVKSRRSIGVLALVFLFLQLAVAPNISLWSGHPNFCLVFAAYVALTIGGQAGVICGFVSGLVFDFTSTSPIGLMAFLLTCASFALGVEVHDRIADDPSSTLVPFAIATLVVELCYHLAMLVVGLTSSFFGVVFLRTLPSTLLTVIAYLPFAFLGRRHGGGPALGKHVGGSQYSLPRR